MSEKIEENGETTYINIEAYKKLEAQLKDANEVIGFYGSREAWQVSARNQLVSHEIINEDVDPIGDSILFHGGKKAREYRAKYPENV